jgi:NADPH:quinone reductase-like Zn-dependent oxidoreductase/SAM-dependent methyltransferase
MFSAFSDDGAAGVYLPVEIRHLRVYGRTASLMWSHARLVEQSSRSTLADLDVYDDSGNLLIEARGIRCKLLDAGRSESIEDLVYEYLWRLEPRPGQTSLGAAADLPAPHEIAAAIKSEVDRIDAGLGLIEKNDRIERELDPLCAAFIVRALGQLDPSLQTGERFTTESLVGRLGIAPRHRGVMGRYLRILEEDGILKRAGAKWELRLHPDSVDANAMWKESLSTNPAYHAELTLLGRCGGRLADVLRGGLDPLQLIFPEGSLAVAEHLYQDSPLLRFYNLVAQHAVSTFIESLPQGRSLRVLEIGAGTGGLSAYVLSRLPADQTRYDYTDLSNAFFLKAKEKFRDYPFIDYRILNIEGDPLEQGFQPHSFDLILASEVLHATADMRRTLANVKRLLASEGLLLMVEGVRPSRWIDLVFGLTEGWWRFSDRDLRSEYPLLSLAKWRSLLAEMEFTSSCEASGRNEATVKNAVILARGPRLDEEPRQDASVEPEMREPATWLVLSDRGGTGEKIAERLRARGQCPVLVQRADSFRRLAPFEFQISPTEVEHVQHLLKEIADLPACRGIVHLWNFDAPALEEATSESIDDAMIYGCFSVVRLVQALSELHTAEAPRLWLLTRGAQSVGRHSEPTSVAQGAVWGLGRVVINEAPKLRATMADLGLSATDAEIESLCEELLLDGREDEIALRGEARYVHRIVRTADREDSGARRVVRFGSQPYRLEPSRFGTLDKLTLRATSRRPPGPGQVEIQVFAAGLNFSDVMKALGLYPGLPEGPVPLGIECSGRIASVGEGVDGFEPGDDVLAIAPFSFGSFVTTDAHLVGKKPPGLSFEEAATVPIAFLTARYALDHLGRLDEGERVLIHSASGGVGLAAIQLAHRAGAEVFATAGTREKRDFLLSLGVQHVHDSRALSFADEVLQATGGEGVDIVLNSLAGEAIHKGLSVLRDHGRFLEIGKRDIYMGSRLDLRPFRKNLSFMAIDLDRAMRERPKNLYRMFAELVEDFRQKRLSPLPYRVFPISNVVSAFRYMAQAKHIGKIVVSLQEESVAVAPSSEETTSFRADASYLISGGLGGFGLTVAGWMVERGARNLVLIGRSGAGTAEARRAVEAMRARGATVMVAPADISDAGAVGRVFADLEASMPPLRGVMHAAMVLEDSLLLNMNEEQMRKVWAPKVLGALRLHRQTEGRPLDFFVFFSSMSSVLGAGGQANYASSNTFLDSLAHHRQAKGLPGVTVSWGYLADVGFVARHKEIGDRFEAMGLRSFKPEEALRLLDRFLREETPNVSVMRVDWEKFGSFLGLASVPPRFADLAREMSVGDTSSQKPSAASVRKALLSAPPAERREKIVALVSDQVSRILDIPRDKLDVERPLTELGLDSLMAVELRNWVEGDLRISLPSVELLRGPSISRLAEILDEQFGKIDAGAAPSGKSSPARSTEDSIPRSGGAESEGQSAQELLARVDELSEEEVDGLLEQMEEDAAG